MTNRRPISELGSADDWLAPAYAARRERAGKAPNKHASPPRSDSGSYPDPGDAGDINRYRSWGQGPASEGFLPACEVGDLPGPELDGQPLEDRDRRIRMCRTDQVNVRLTTAQFSALERAGELYGLSPTEMARLFINRGARAVLTRMVEG